MKKDCFSQAVVTCQKYKQNSDLKKIKCAYTD